MKTDRHRRSSYDVELEALARLGAARDLLDHVLAGNVVPLPWVTAAAGLIAQAEQLLQKMEPPAAA
jgi:hypothetical protein